MADSTSEPSSFNLEKALTEIKAIVDQMQVGMPDFDQQMQRFQEGQQLIAACRKYLGSAELKIQQLIEGTYKDFDEKY